MKKAAYPSNSILSPTPKSCSGEKIIPTNADFLGVGKKYGEAGNLITKRRKEGDAFSAFPAAQARQHEARATRQRLTHTNVPAPANCRLTGLAFCLSD